MTLAPTHSKQAVLDWLRCELGRTQLELDSSAVSQCLDAAWEHLNQPGVLKAEWKAWVLAMVLQTKAKAKGSPGGYLRNLLTAGPGRDLTQARKASVNLADHRETEGRKALDQVRELRAAMDGVAVLPLAALSAAHRMYREGGEASPKRRVHELVQAWERDGSPDPATWDYPGWSLCMEAAR